MQKLLITMFLVLLISCSEDRKEVKFKELTNLELSYLKNEKPDSLIEGKTYLPIYSEIYSRTMNTKYLTTATISIRNTNLNDKIYIDKIDYYNTQGNKIRTYLKNTIFLEPMETKEIVIEYLDKEGGSGANFVFDWSCKPNINKPYFQAVMVTITGSFGLSFTTEGIDIN